MKLFSKTRLANKVNLRRMCALFLSLYVAFDYAFITYASSEIEFPVEFTVFLDVPQGYVDNSSYVVTPRDANFYSGTYKGTTSSGNYAESQFGYYDLKISIRLRTDNDSLPAYTYWKANNYVRLNINCDRSAVGTGLTLVDYYTDEQDIDFILSSPQGNLKIGDSLLNVTKAANCRFLFDNLKVFDKFSEPITFHLVFYGQFYNGVPVGQTSNMLQNVTFNVSLSTLKWSFNESNFVAPGTIEAITNDNREEDRADAEHAGDDSKSFVEDALDLENKWEILWFPIKFTNQILEVFSGGTQAASYAAAYGNIVGYTYDEDTGYLLPVIDRQRAQARAGGTIISFPEFTLPVLNVKLWDSYDFDLSSIKDDFPLIFDSLYVVISILEVYWFVGFLRDKFEEVFG